MAAILGPLLLVPFLLLAPAARAQESVELIVVGGTIHTMDENAPSAEALAVAGGAIVAIGERERVLAMRGEGTTVLDVEGRTVIPGLIDAHGHVFELGKFLRTIDLVGTPSADEVAALVRAAAAERRPGEWILGRGWDQNDWSVKEFPTRALLDEAAPENPVYLTRVDGHAGWANGRALEAAGIVAATPDPDGGRIIRDAAGAPTGILVDAAEALIEEVIPPADAVEAVARLTAAQEHMVSVGLTGVHDMGSSRQDLVLFRAWADSERLGPRIVSYIYVVGPDTLLTWWESEGASAIGTAPVGRFRVRGVKLVADGALGSRGAALLAPYSDDPDNVGLLVTPADVLTARAVRARELGLQPAIHAIGDRGNRIALDAISRFADLQAASPPASTLRPRIEHAQVLAREDIPRFAALGVIASVQPTHATSDMPWAEDRVGPQRIEGAYAWQRLRSAGVRLACGSDFPVEDANPFHGLYAAISRQDAGGNPAGGWRPDERLTREEALACFTRDAAWAAGMEDEVGALAVGRRADFLVLDRDPLAVPVADVRETRVLRTVIDGETVYGALDPGGAPSEAATRAGR